MFNAFKTWLKRLQLLHMGYMQRSNVSAKRMQFDHVWTAIIPLLNWWIQTPRISTVFLAQSQRFQVSNPRPPGPWGRLKLSSANCNTVVPFRAWQLGTFRILHQEAHALKSLKQLMSEGASHGIWWAHVMQFTLHGLHVCKVELQIRLARIFLLQVVRSHAPNQVLSEFGNPTPVHTGLNIAPTKSLQATTKAYKSIDSTGVLVGSPFSRLHSLLRTIEQDFAQISSGASLPGAIFGSMS